MFFASNLKDFSNILLSDYEIISKIQINLNFILSKDKI